MIKKFWKWVVVTVVQQCSCTYNWVAHLKLVEVVNCMSIYVTIIMKRRSLKYIPRLSIIPRKISKISGFQDPHFGFTSFIYFYLITNNTFQLILFSCAIDTIPSMPLLSVFLPPLSPPVERGIFCPDFKTQLRLIMEISQATLVFILRSPSSGGRYGK